MARAGVIVPGVGHFARRRTLDRGWRARHPRAARRRHAAARHLPRPAVALRRQHRGAGRPGLRRLPGAARSTAGCGAGDRRPAARCRTSAGTRWPCRAAVAPARRRCRRLAGLLHALLRGARWPEAPSPRATYGVAVHRGGGTKGRCPACSSTRRSPERSGCRCCATVLVGVPSMLAKRIIACLDVRDGQVVKGVKFEGLRAAGDPAELARRYDLEGIDEVVILDVTATLEARQALAHTIQAVARELFHPALRRRRHSQRKRRGGGHRRRRRQGEPQHGSARRPIAHHAARRTLRQPGGGRGHRRQERRRSLDGLHAQRQRGHTARRSQLGASRPHSAAPARFC